MGCLINFLLLLLTQELADFLAVIPRRLTKKFGWESSHSRYFLISYWFLFSNLANSLNSLNLDRRFSYTKWSSPFAWGARILTAIHLLRYYYHSHIEKKLVKIENNSLIFGVSNAFAFLKANNDFIFFSTFLYFFIIITIKFSTLTTHAYIWN